MNTKTSTNQRGATVIQLIIVIAVVAITSAFAFMGITSARAHIRRSNSARLFASYVERARADAVRRHGTTSIQQVNTSTYSVTMDFSGSGNVTTQNFSTENGVTINMPRTVGFDWRGRTPIETSVGFTNTVAGVVRSINVNITGSGDVTLDSEIFLDSWIPGVILNGSGGSVISDGPTPNPSASATPTPDPSASATPTPDPSASATPTPDPSASATPTPDPSASATPTPNPTATPTPIPTPTPVPCTMTATPSSIMIAENGSGTVSVVLNNSSGTKTISAESSNSGQIQVAPASVNVNGSTAASFTITVKKQSGSVAFSNSSCGTQTVTVGIQ